MKAFRLISLLEGFSLLILLLIAMPLKYQFGLTEVVFYAGSLHGLLFSTYLVMSLTTSHRQGWPILKWLMIFLASIVPFSFIFVDDKLTAEIRKQARSNQQPTTSPIA